MRMQYLCGGYNNIYYYSLEVNNNIDTMIVHHCSCLMMLEERANANKKYELHIIRFYSIKFNYYYYYYYLLSSPHSLIFFFLTLLTLNLNWEQNQIYIFSNYNTNVIYYVDYVDCNFMLFCDQFVIHVSEMIITYYYLIFVKILISSLVFTAKQ